MNLALRVLGPQTERGLCVRLLALQVQGPRVMILILSLIPVLIPILLARQVVCCGGAFGVRYLAAGYYK